MAMCDYYLCDVCGQKCFYDASIAEYDADGRYLLSGSAVDIAAICEACAKTHTCIVVPKASGVVHLAAERARQQSQEGYTEAHDDAHRQCEMALAAVAYALHAAGPWETAQYWPFDASEWKPSDQLHDLVRAGALIAAEIDRLQRMSATSAGEAR